jgi:hypothetical protein
MSCNYTAGKLRSTAKLHVRLAKPQKMPLPAPSPQTLGTAPAKALLLTSFTACPHNQHELLLLLVVAVVVAMMVVVVAWARLSLLSTGSSCKRPQQKFWR